MYESQSAPVPASERRQRRSEDTVTALHYQLAAARSEATMSAVVLVDDQGLLIAGAGTWPACEELAAYAPLFADPRGISSADVGARVRELSPQIAIQTMDLEGSTILVCGQGASPSQGAVVARAAAGCRRILAGA